MLLTGLGKRHSVFIIIYIFQYLLMDTGYGVRGGVGFSETKLIRVKNRIPVNISDQTDIS